MSTIASSEIRRQLPTPPVFVLHDDKEGWRAKLSMFDILDIG
jgi:hypothetical protein